ncbi:hypothetical protein BC628DRAFT_1419341 [Trametes gibbosa]|nr:hypothetical protein BC628DRAFT_1419341 [Trametes gibbosa]
MLHSIVHAAEASAPGHIDADAWHTLYHSSGAVLIGGLVALFLSGAVLLQVVLYCQMYPSDSTKVKCVVALIWILDCIHSAMVGIANWQNLVVNFGKFDGLDGITWSIAVSTSVDGLEDGLQASTDEHVFKITVALTATTTFIVHWFYMLLALENLEGDLAIVSRGNWWITGPLFTLATIRLVAAIVSTAEMLQLKSFSQFVDQYSYVFTLGLSTSTLLDILITGILCYYLRQRRSGLARMDHVIGVLTLYTIENGMLTCITTAISLVCWVAMPHNLIFLGLHLAISKMYANSFLASVNARKGLSSRSQGSSGVEGYQLPTLLPSPYSPQEPRAPWSPGTRSMLRSPPAQKPVHVNIQIEQTVHPELFGGYQEDPQHPSRASRDDVKHT